MCPLNSEMFKFTFTSVKCIAIVLIFYCMPSDAAVGKQKTINKVKAYLSTFITDTQLDKVDIVFFDIASEHIVNFRRAI